MQVVHNKADLRAALRQVRADGKTVGFVPTMGYLHEGHLSLVRRANQENDAVVVSIFVNPTQFGPGEDLEAYPRDTDRDLDLLRAEKVDVVFMPAADAIYPEGYATYVQVEGPTTQTLCGRSRPTHFRGVTTIVAKLFHLVGADRAYFGQKDAQQVAVLQKMVRDLEFELQIVVCPIVREPDGLAMSSRNTYLSAQHRIEARKISQALFEARDAIAKGERLAATIVAQVKKRFDSIDNADIDYISCVDAMTLKDVEALNGVVLIAVALKLGSTRLIDNIRVEV